MREVLDQLTKAQVSDYMKLCGEPFALEKLWTLPKPRE
jgi:hypothetical protein